MSSFMSSFIILIAVLAGIAVVVALLSVAALRIYSEPQAQERNEEVAEQVKRQLADMRNSLSPKHERVGQGNNDIVPGVLKAGQRNKESAEEAASQAQGTVRQDAHQSRALEAEPWATFHRGSIFEERGEYDLAVEAYQQVIALGHPDAAPRAAFNLGMLFEERAEYDRAEEAYRQAINSKHAEWAPKAAFKLGRRV